MKELILFVNYLHLSLQLLHFGIYLPIELAGLVLHPVPLFLDLSQLFLDTHDVPLPLLLLVLHLLQLSHQHLSLILLCFVVLVALLEVTLVVSQIGL